MARVLTTVWVLGLATLFAWGVPLLRLFDAFQPMVVALSIMVAAVFVRLNRGMPALEWKSLELKKRTQLTTRIVDLSREYGWIITIDAVALSGLIALTVIGKDDIRTNWPGWTQQLSAGVIGATMALSVARMAYVVWRDCDIVKLQKYLIDASAARDASELETRASAEKIANIRSAGLRRIAPGEPKAWGE
jgi:hypothetical protein